MKKILAIQNYQCKSELRKVELVQCMQHNISIGFDLIYVFNDSIEPEFFGENIVNVNINRRFNYRDFLDVASLSFLSDALVVTANSDIKIDSNIFQIYHYMSDRHMCCFTRYESDSDIALHPWCTQDVWAVKSQNFPTSVINAANIPLGTPGCELRFSEIFYSAGYDIYNPSLSIKNIHVHAEENPHSDKDRNFGAYLFTEPCRIEHIGNPAVARSNSHLVYLNGADSNKIYKIDLI